MSKMEFKINASPHLNMSEITKRLFNQNFHADVQFSIGGKIIYAHSLELIKRSVVFEQQLEDTMGDTKLMPVNDCKYGSFYEFIRYIYTDECTINDDNFVDILKLAAKYKFIKLENEVLRLGKSSKWLLRCFNHCVREKYEMARNFVDIREAFYFTSHLKHEQFLLFHPDAVDELLKLERVPKGVTELQIFTALAGWFTSNCKMHQITLAEGRQRWDKLIRRIRFPTMSIEELRDCYKKYPDLLTDSDCRSIAGQAVFGGGVSDIGLWISKGRAEFIWPNERKKFEHSAENKTTFSVSKETILFGIRIGVELQLKPIEIEISEIDDKTRVSEKLKFVQNSQIYFEDLIISLGDSLRLKPNCKYAISIKYLETDGILKVVCRTKITDVIVNDPGKTVKLTQAGTNMLEMFFKPATD